MATNPLIAALERRAFAARIPVYKLCERAGVSRASFSMWKAGKNPSARTLGMVEDAMTAIEKERRDA